MEHLRTSNCLTILMILIVSVLANACGCSCNCTLIKGETFAVVRPVGFADSTLFYQAFDYQSLRVRQGGMDSLNNFVKLNTTDSTYVQLLDSIRTQQFVEDLTCRDSKGYVADGYYCNCAK